MKIPGRFLTILSIVAFLVLGTAYGQDLTEREKEMRALIERLEQRVDQLERSNEEAKPSPELDRRVQELEDKTVNIEPAKDSDFRVYWKEGLRLDSRDGAFKLKFGGRIMNDWAFFSEDSDLKAAFGNIEDGTEFRRARLYISGDIYERVMFKAQYDFAGGDADFKDMYIGFKKLPGVGNLKIGHVKEPFGLEELTSSKYITFMERSLTSPFTPGRNTGLLLYNHALDQRLTWAAGVFQDADGFGDGTADGNFSVTGRVTGLPWYKDKGEKLLHLGLSLSHRDIDETVRFRERPEAHLSSVRFVDTASFAADEEFRLGAEAAVVRGPFSAQAEYMQSSVDADGTSDKDFAAYYVMGSYFLTGEHRAYKPSAGAFSRVKPKRNFTFGGENRGWGAWELGLRYSSIDLDDGTIEGGEQEDITLGLNWHLNPNVRIMWNYIHADVDHALYDGDADILQTRFQVDF